MEEHQIRVEAVQLTQVRLHGGEVHAADPGGLGPRPKRLADPEGSLWSQMVPQDPQDSCRGGVLAT